jgi:hypothetical protein
MLRVIAGTVRGVCGGGKLARKTEDFGFEFVG